MTTSKTTKTTTTPTTPTTIGSFTAIVKGKVAEGWTKKKIEAYLIFNDDASPKEIAKAFKEAGVTTSKPKTFASEYYAWLSIKQRTNDEATAYILGTGLYGETSANVKAHKSHYLAILDLSIAIWVGK